MRDELIEHELGAKHAPANLRRSLEMRVNQAPQRRYIDVLKWL